MAAGLDSEFEQFVARRSVMMLRTAYLLTGDVRDAEDVLQVSLLRVARRWSSAREAQDITFSFVAPGMNWALLGLLARVALMSVPAARSVSSFRVRR